MNEQYREAEAEREDDADRRISFARTLTQDPEQNRRQGATDQRTGADTEPGEQRESRSGKRQLAGAVYREGHLPHDDERPDQTRHQRQQRGGEQRLLDEVAAQQVGGDVE